MEPEDTEFGTPLLHQLSTRKSASSDTDEGCQPEGGAEVAALKFWGGGYAFQVQRVIEKQAAMLSFSGREIRSDGAKKFISKLLARVQRIVDPDEGKARGFGRKLSRRGL